MKILQMANGYLDNRLYENLFHALAQQGVHNEVYVPINVAGHIPEVPAGVQVSRCFSTLDRALFFRKQKKMIRDMERIYRMPSMDVIHAHTLFSAGYAARQFQKKYGIPYIVAVRNTDVNVFFKYMIHLRGVGIDILRHAEKIVFLSPVYREKVLREYVPAKYHMEIAEKSVIIPNGIASLFFENKAQAKKADNGNVRLIYVGELNSNKNPELTIQAAEILNDQGIPTTLTVVGTIKEEKYRTLIQNTPFVQHFERCPQEEVLQHLEDADIFVMPSHTETFGLVYAEAMSQGLPVLYTRGEGFDGQFPEGEVGYAVSDTDPKELAEKIRAIMDDYERLSQNCIRLVERFHWEFIAKEYQKIYETITGE